MKKKRGHEIPKQTKKDGKEIRGIVRIAGKDLRGDLQLKRAMSRIPGIGKRLSGIVSEIALKQLSLPETTVVGELTEEQISKLEEVIASPVKYGVPKHMINRQKDSASGAYLHLTGNDLRFAMSKDVEREKTINSWRGYRHTYGQKVRGQRTRSTGRTGMSVGVLRKSLMKGGAAKAAQKEEKK